MGSGLVTRFRSVLGIVKYGRLFMASQSGAERGDPLEWFSFDTFDLPCQVSPRPTLDSEPRGFVQGRVLSGQTLPISFDWPVGPSC